MAAIALISSDPDGWKPIGPVGVLAAPATTITMAVDGDAAGSLMIEAEIISGGAASLITLSLNGGALACTQRVDAVAAASGYGVGYLSAVGSSSSLELIFRRAWTGAVRHAFGSGAHFDIGNTYENVCGVHVADTTTNITSISLTCANGFAIGTRYRAFQRPARLRS